VPSAVRRLAALLPLPFVIALAAWSSGRVADATGRRIAGVLVGMSQSLAPAEPRDGDAELEFGGELAAPTIPAAAAAPASAPSKPSKKRAANKSTPAARGVFVSAETVLKLANRRSVPRGVAVKADGKRPAGLRLTNVNGLGIGLRDGDVLTRAVGQPALSSGAVVQAVLMARAQRARFLDGEFWRDGERYSLRVEQPYPNAP
jgi:hypothetical protein